MQLQYMMLDMILEIHYKFSSQPLTIALLHRYAASRIYDDNLLRGRNTMTLTIIDIKAPSI